MVCVSLHKPCVKTRFKRNMCHSDRNDMNFGNRYHGWADNERCSRSKTDAKFNEPNELSRGQDSIEGNWRSTALLPVGGAGLSETADLQ